MKAAEREEEEVEVEAEAEEDEDEDEDEDEELEVPATARRKRRSRSGRLGWWGWRWSRGAHARAKVHDITVSVKCPRLRITLGQVLEGRGTGLGGAGRTGAGFVVDVIHAPPGCMVPKICGVIASHATTLALPTRITPHTASHEGLAHQDGQGNFAHRGARPPCAALGGATALQLAEVVRIAAGAAGAQHGEQSVRWGKARTMVGQGPG